MNQVTIMSTFRMYFFRGRIMRAHLQIKCKMTSWTSEPLSLFAKASFSPEPQLYYVIHKSTYLINFLQILHSRMSGIHDCQNKTQMIKRLSKKFNFSSTEITSALFWNSKFPLETCSLLL